MSIAEKLTTIAENQQRVYDAGQQAEYDRFWDLYQQNGTRYNYQYGAFGGTGWTDATYKPKYPVKPKHPYMMFMGCGMTEIKGVDFSNANDLQNTFAYSTSLVRIGAINAPSATNASNILNGCTKLQTVENLTIGEACYFNANSFNCAALENITIGGVIGCNVDFHLCTKLTHDSLMSIINALKNLTGTGTTYTLTLGATNLAKLTDAEKAIATEKGWTLA